jgi:TetR/AcrR family transcriptional regulator, transcriptional repressor for nem operon
MDTREHILDSARKLAQQRGFNAFSYADIAEAVGVRKASIHHHFASKDDLALELVRRYRADFLDRLSVIANSCPTAQERLRRYGGLFLETLAAGGICLCGMMASDIAALSPDLREPLRAFFEDQVGWLTWVLESGSEAGELTLANDAGRHALVVLASLEGGLLVAHALKDSSVLESLLEDIISGLLSQ